jgi:hypothetical protein
MPAFGASRFDPRTISVRPDAAIVPRGQHTRTVAVKVVSKAQGVVSSRGR